MNSKSTRIHELSWHRVGPWLPWMDMGEAKGYMMYTADGAKVANFSEVPELIRKEIETRCPDIAQRLGMLKKRTRPRGPISRPIPKPI